MPSFVTDRPDRAPAPRGEARKAAITEAALAVIAGVGPDGLRHRLVAAEAGLPTAATTWWCASTEEMADRRAVGLGLLSVLAEVLRDVGAPSTTAGDAALLGATIDGIVSHHVVVSGPFDRSSVTAQLERLTAALVTPG
jgi:DNA-binding transcriptional regulator YbjK